MAGSWQTALAALWAADSSRNLTILWTSLPIIGAMLIGAGIIAWVKRWREQPRSFNLTASDELAHFRSLYDKGELSAEEFTRLQTVLGERIKKELDIPAAATAPAAPQSSLTSGSPGSATQTLENPAANPPSANGVSAPPDGHDKPGPQDLPRF